MINLDQAQKVIAQIHQPFFDSHDFIEQFSKDFEKEYVEMLFEKKEATNGIFRTTHAEIGRFLSKNQTALGILSKKKITSLNIKGYLSDNQEWQKL